MNRLPTRPTRAQPAGLRAGRHSPEDAGGIPERGSLFESTLDLWQGLELVELDSWPPEFASPARAGGPARACA